LIAVLEPIAPKFKEHKFYAQVFQAIRMEVNNELDVLEKFLEQTQEVIKPPSFGGDVLSFTRRSFG